MGRFIVHHSSFVDYSKRIICLITAKIWSKWKLRPWPTETADKWKWIAYLELGQTKNWTSTTDRIYIVTTPTPKWCWSTAFLGSHTTLANWFLNTSLDQLTMPPPASIVSPLTIAPERHALNSKSQPAIGFVHAHICQAKFPKLRTRKLPDLASKSEKKNWK